jgi:curved DNA-binding protein CbpA
VVSVPPPVSHYETLGLDPRATPDQVEKAYRFCLEMYGEDALATYSLLEPHEVRAARLRIQEAYEVLRDPTRRLEHDVSLGLEPPPASLLIPFPAQAGRGPRPAPQVLSGPVTGPELRRLRESRGISLRAIAAASKVGVTTLEYIEADRHDRLPAPVYLRGFLHEYARALGLEPRSMAEAYMARMAHGS